jgi:hypothetical protein
LGAGALKDAPRNYIMPAQRSQDTFRQPK